MLNYKSNGHVFALLSSLMLPILTFFRTSPTALIYIFTAWGVSNVLGSKRLPSLRAIINNKLVQLLFIFLAYGAASAGWSEYPLLSLKTAASLLCLGLASVVFYYVYSSAPSNLGRLFSGLAIGVIIMTLFVTYDVTHKLVLINMVKGHPIEMTSFYSRVAVLLAFLVWPMIWRLFKSQSGEKLLLMLAIVSAVVTLAVLEHAASKTVIIIGIVVFGLSYVMPRVIAWLICALTAGYLLLSPLIHKSIDPSEVIALTPHHKMITFHHRLYIWEFVAQRAMNKPLCGHGFDAMRKDHNFGNMKTQWHAFMAAHSTPKGGSNIHLTFDPPFHAHNLALQLWYEMGLVGIMLAMAVLVMITRKVTQLNLRASEAGMVNACFAGFILIMHSSFDVWQTWWVATIVFIVTLLRHILPHE